MRVLGLNGFRKQGQRIEVEPTDDPLYAPERQVALASLDGAHVGPVDPQDIRERLLAQSLCLPVGPQIAPHGPLKIAFHIGNAPDLLLDSLQTYK